MEFRETSQTLSKTTERTKNYYII